MSEAKDIAAPAVGPLRLVCISDTHGFHRKLAVPPGDILIFAGDFDGRTVEQVDDFNAWLGTLPYRHKLVIAGNHDLLFDRDPKRARAHLTEAIYLEDSGVTLEGLKFWGSPVNSVLGEEWAFSRERMIKIRKHWDRIPEGTDVLITHEPPYGTLDKPHILAKHAGMSVPARCHASRQAPAARLRACPRRVWPGIRMERHDPGQLCRRRWHSFPRQRSDGRGTQAIETLVGRCRHAPAFHLSSTCSAFAMAGLSFPQNFRIFSVSESATSIASDRTAWMNWPWLKT